MPWKHSRSSNASTLLTSTGHPWPANVLCLNQGSHVLAGKAADESGMFAVFWPAGTGPSRDIDISQWPATAFEIMLPDAPRGWTLFSVDEPQCYDALVVGGRTRIYSVEIAIRWDE